MQKDNHNILYDKYRHKSEKNISLLNSRLLDVHKWSDYPEVKNATNSIREEITIDLRKKGAKRLHDNKIQKTLRVILVDLFHNYSLDPDRYIAYSRNNNSYGIEERYNKLHIKSRNLIKTIDSLKDLGYIEDIGGFIDKDTGIGYNSRMKPTDTLINKITTHNVSPEMIGKFPDTETIWLRNQRKKFIDYEDNKQTADMRNHINKYNELLASRRFELDGRVFPQQHTHRVFNNNSFDQGGRFYGGDWQLLKGKKETRNRILIEGSNVIELDYKGLHICMLYARKGIEYMEDPYEISGYDSQYRALIKVASLTTINAGSFEEARRAIQSKMNKGMFPKLNVSKLLIDFEAKHDKIKEYFYSGIGTYLQNIDSMITDEILSYFTDKDILVLPVHDSYIIPVDYKNELNDIMIDKYKKYNNSINIRID